MDNRIQPGGICGERYRIVRQLGEVHFERTYLAEDSHRFNELCLLKEILTHGSSAGVANSLSPETIEKAQEIFEKQAKLLPNLHHPQLANFRELLRIEQEDTASLFLVEDYLEGKTYRELLELRLQEEKTFTEAEVIQLLFRILPVLQYLHDHGIIHQKICPNHIIQRQSDQFPVLINLWNLKHFLVNTTVSEDQSQKQIPPIGKVGYAPQEQIQGGSVFAHSDLYALAATGLALLTGKEPLEFIDPQTQQWDGKTGISLGAKLTRIFSKMLQKNPEDRYQSAQEVIQSLNQPASQLPLYPGTQPLETQATVVITPVTEPPTAIPDSSVSDSPMSSIDRITHNPTFGCLTKLIFVVMLIWGAGMGGWFAGKAWIQYVILQPTSSSDILRSGQSSQANVSPVISEAELQRKTALRHRRRELGIDSQFFSQLVAQLFVFQAPEQQGKALTDQPEDAPGREQWDKLAAEALEQLSFLSPEALKGLGSYTQEQRDRSIKAVNQLHLSSHAFYDLVDANFVAHFPQQEKPDFSGSLSSGQATRQGERPLGQVWQAIALDTLKALQSGKAYEQVNLASDGSATPVRGILQPGEGKASVVYLNASQTMAIKLEADGDTFLSIYSPTGKNNPLEDSSAHQWSGVLPESGFYEFTLVSKAKQPLNYQLALKIQPVETQSQ